VTGTDASAGALDVARRNARDLNLAVDFVAWDLFAGLPAGPWDLVVSNPPYVRADEIELLEPEVRDWEPRTALVGDGATLAVACGARDVLRAGGALVLEVAEGDAGRVSELLRELGYAEIMVTRDLAGRDRIVEGVTTSAD
jgi:release factor glutamine methyltransferase